MSKITNMRDGGKDLRWRLLTTVSAVALLVSIYGSGDALASGDESDHPLVWIELGGQLDGLSDSQEQYSPPFLASITRPGFLSTLNVQRPPSLAIDEDGQISFQPDGSDWVFSASIRYGRSAANRHTHQQTPNVKFPVHFTIYGKYLNRGVYYPSGHVNFADGKTSQSDAHTIIDFQAGKDLGLGMFGGHGSSVVGAGVRIAQFDSRSAVNLNAIPDLQYPSAPITTFPAKYAHLHSLNINFHAYTGLANIQRSFRGLGPSLSWNASAPVAGNSERGELEFDWGINGAVLFGRQKTNGHHQTTVRSYHKTQWLGVNGLEGEKCGQTTKCVPGAFVGPSGVVTGYNYPGAKHHSTARDFNRERSVVVPNVGGFAGLSFEVQNFKVSAGYRADFFFGPMDGGIDTAKKENVGFYGPFASVSVGLGG